MSDQTPVVDSIRALRDEKLATTGAGLKWIDLDGRPGHGTVVGYPARESRGVA